MSRRTPLTPEQRQAKLDEAHNRLVQAVGELRSSDDWLRYLAAMNRFHRYSASNVLLIVIQRPDATQVAGYTTWKALGRQVNKGAKGIAIFAPVTAKRTVENDEAPADTDTEPGTVKRIVGFRLTYVFDVADTSGDPLPQVPSARLLDGDAPTQMWDALATQVVGAGFTVQLVDEIDSCPGAHGVSDMLAKTVQVATTGRSKAAQAKCLAHELAHVLLHRGVDYRAERGRFEVEAESVAYLVSLGLRPRHHGLHPRLRDQLGQRRHRPGARHRTDRPALRPGRDRPGPAGALRGRAGRGGVAAPPRAVRPSTWGDGDRFLA